MSAGFAILALAASLWALIFFAQSPRFSQRRMLRRIGKLGSAAILLILGIYLLATLVLLASIR